MNTVLCACGQRFKVAEGSSARKVKCPGCGDVVLLPARVGGTIVSPESPRNEEGPEATVTHVAANAQDTGVDDVAEARVADAPEPPFASLGGYRIIRKLGQGGMGAVFEAEDSRLERRLAIKVMKPEIAKNPLHRERFLREARVAAKVECDYICPIYQVGEDNDVPYIAMPLLKSESLAAALKRAKKQRIPIPEIVRIGREVAEGLSAAHEAGLIHRDIKPANIWLESQRNGPPRARILDFGLARAQGAQGDDGQLTQSGAILGTPAYMSPEQARGDKNVDSRTDLFSLGCVLYSLCVGETPFKGDSTMAILMSLAGTEPSPPDEVSPTPKALSDLIVRLLSKDPARRPRSAREVIDALTRIDREPAAAAQPALNRRERSETKRRETPPPRGPLVAWLVAGGLACLLVVAGTVAVVLAIRPSNGPADSPKVAAQQDGVKKAEIPSPNSSDTPPKIDPPVSPKTNPKTAPPEPKSKIEFLREFKGHEGGVWSVDLSADGAKAISGGGGLYLEGGPYQFGKGRDYDVRLWQTATGTPLHVLKGHTNIVRSVAMSPTGKLAASGSFDKSVRLWDVALGKEHLPPLLGHTDAVTGVAFLPDGEQLVTVSTDGSVRLWDVKTGDIVNQFNPGVGEIHSVGVDSIRNAYVGTKDNSVLQFALDTGKKGIVCAGANGRQGYIAVSEKLQAIATGNDTKPSVGSYWRNNNRMTFPGHAVRFTLDGRWLLVGGENGEIVMFDPRNLAPRHETKGHSAIVQGVAVSADGVHLVSGSWDGSVKFWRLPSE